MTHIGFVPMQTDTASSVLSPRLTLHCQCSFRLLLSLEAANLLLSLHWHLWMLLS